MLFFSRLRAHMGEITAEITGLKAQEILSIAHDAGITLYNVRRLAYTRICATMSIHEYFKLRRLLPKDSYRIHVVASRGLLWLLFGLRRRYCLIGGMLICFILLLTASTRVWNVRISGCDSEELTAKIAQQLNDYGLTLGSSPSGEYLDECEKKLIESNPSLIWAGISRKGVDLQVFIKEKDESYLQGSTAEPADVIADKIGLIEEILVMQGVPMVEKGQLVRTGQILISGQISYNDEPYRYVHAQGIIRARVWYSAQKTVPLYTFDVQRTGRTCTVSTLHLLGIEVPTSGENPYTSWESETHEKTVMQLGIPVTVTETVYYETQSIRRELSPQEAADAASAELRGQLDPLPENAEILSENTRYTQSEGSDTISVTLYVETLEEIGITETVRQDP